MQLKQLGAVLLVTVALGAVTASTALAAAVTKDATWRVGAAGTVLSGTETIRASGNTELAWEVGTTKLVVKSTGLECLSCRIENVGGTAVGEGKLKFTGVTVVTPTACAIEGGEITTEQLRIKADYMAGSGNENFVLLEPAATVESRFALLKVVTGAGGCSIMDNYNLTGSVFTKSSNATGVYAASQAVTSSGTINSEAGGALKVGPKLAALTGTITFALSGTRNGEVFGTHE